jgi:uncharacterized protein (DUF2267 family)
MTTTGLAAWDRTIQATNIWLDDIMQETGLDRQGAWHALGAVLRALRDRLPPALALHLAAQLPLLLRGAFCEQWHLGGAPPEGRGLDDFLAAVEQHLGRGQPGDAAAVTPAAFRAIARHVEPGQLQKVLTALPAGIRGPLTDAAAG